jgi:magnesium-transporting ATPase (P-type)
MPKAAMSLGVLVILLQLVNIYAFFTYVGELNKTKCKCAVDKQPLLNKIMDVYRWFQVIIILFIVIAIIFIILFMRSIFSKIDSRK